MKELRSTDSDIADPLFTLLLHVPSPIVNSVKGMLNARVRARGLPPSGNGSIIAKIKTPRKTLCFAMFVCQL